MAAKSGYLDVLEVVLASMPIDQDHGTFHTYGKVIQSAAAHQKWAIVNQLLDQYMYDVPGVYLNAILCWAAKYGQDDVIRKVLNEELYYFTFSRSKGSPLLEAASGGYLSICRLILETTTWRQDCSRRFETLARSVARGGNIEIYHLFQQQNPPLWNPGHEIHFLPIAAEHGNVEFAKFAIAKGCDQGPKPNHLKSPHKHNHFNQLQYQEDLRYFALLRAVSCGHLEFVRWLVEDVGADIGFSSTLADDPCPSLLLAAVDTGRIEMVRLLKWKFGADALPEDALEALESEQAREERRTLFQVRIEELCERLYLRKEDYDF